MSDKIHRISVVDTHTGGEPTRIVFSGAPDLGRGSMAERLAVFRERHDRFRSAVGNEPRGSDVMVGAVLCEPADPTCEVGVIFFNNVGYLGMCGHGTIGVAVALAHLGAIELGTHRFETPVGVVTVTLDDPNHVSIENVPSYAWPTTSRSTSPGWDASSATWPGEATGFTSCTTMERRSSWRTWSA